MFKIRIKSWKINTFSNKQWLLIPFMWGCINKRSWAIRLPLIFSSSRSIMSNGIMLSTALLIWLLIWSNMKTSFTLNDIPVTYLSLNLYLQVVWASSYAVGCGVHFCSNGLSGSNLGSSSIIVCNYGPGQVFIILLLSNLCNSFSRINTLINYVLLGYFWLTVSSPIIRRYAKMNNLCFFISHSCFTEVIIMEKSLTYLVQVAHNVKMMASINVITICVQVCSVIKYTKCSHVMNVFS